MSNRPFPLSDLKKGERSKIIAIDEHLLGSKNFLPKGELELRLLEMGFIEGAEVVLLHEGPLGKDPLAFLVQKSSQVAIRRQEANAILVEKVTRP